MANCLSIVHCIFLLIWLFFCFHLCRGEGRPVWLKYRVSFNSGHPGPDRTWAQFEPSILKIWDHYSLGIATINDVKVMSSSTIKSFGESPKKRVKWWRLTVVALIEARPSADRGLVASASTFDLKWPFKTIQCTSFSSGWDSGTFMIYRALFFKFSSHVSLCVAMREGDLSCAYLFLARVF